MCQFYLCGTDADTLIVDIYGVVPTPHLGSDTTVCEGISLFLTSTADAETTIAWQDGSSQLIYNVNAPGIFNLDISTPCASLSQTVDIIPGTDCFVAEIHNKIYIPNVFSPNGDGINDVFTVSYGADLDVIGMEGSIFDRWGNLVFGSQDIPFRWDGLFNGEHMMPGVYIYTLIISYLDNGQVRVKYFPGDITLIR